MEILKKVAKINARPLNTEDEEKVRVLVHAIAEESHQTEDKLTPIGNFELKRHLAALKLNYLQICFGMVTPSNPLFSV